MSHPFDLRRYVEAQDRMYGAVLDQLGKGVKTGHWMWFVFPQIRGLGGSEMALRYSIQSIDEAAAYLDHSILGPRLAECTRLVIDVTERSAMQIFGYPDCLKFRSSMTLFAHTAQDNQLFETALAKYFDGGHDSLTIDILEQ